MRRRIQIWSCVCLYPFLRSVTMFSGDDRACLSFELLAGNIAPILHHSPIAGYACILSLEALQCFLEMIVLALASSYWRGISLQYFTIRLLLVTPVSFLKKRYNVFWRRSCLP